MLHRATVPTGALHEVTSKAKSYNKSTEGTVRARMSTYGLVTSALHYN